MIHSIINSFYVNLFDLTPDVLLVDNLSTNNQNKRYNYKLFTIIYSTPHYQIKVIMESRTKNILRPKLGNEKISYCMN